MDRFSRDAGEALTMAKKLQTKYNVQIVSVTEGITFDYRDNGSFFRTGLSLLLAEDDNIRRTNKVNSGIYTAKAREGRYIHGKPPYGYAKEGKGKDARLIIMEDQAKVVRFIYDAFLQNMPLCKIREKAKEKGFGFTSNSYVQKILSLPIYSGQQTVKSFKDMPGGLFPAKHEAIVDMFTWQQVQINIKGEPRTRVSVSDEMPL
jgi:DNA invertase Pin-like site-specific DNA recombinase